MKAAASKAQNAAAVPDRSSWVAANAGSGKTRVLTNRVARLLLAGTSPEKILCLTYTKAAAAEMQTRLFAQLGSWAMMPEVDLRATLTGLGEPQDRLTDDRLARARTLFARALETPGGLRIQTIHAFCDALLRRFPLEAGVAPGFTVLEDRQARALRAEVLDALAADGAPELVALAGHLGGDDPDALLREIGQAREAFVAPFAPETLAARLGIDPAEDAAGLATRVLGPDGRDLLRALVPILSGGKTTDQKAAERLAAAIDRPDTVLVQTLEGLFLYGASASTPFTVRTDRFPTKDLRAAHPGPMAALDDLMRRVEDGRSQRLGLLAFARSVALDAFARRWLAALEAHKAARGLLDFDDLIERAKGLFERPETAAWVLWRLDGGIDHILVDEAQDTSPAQWRVIEAISGEFFVGLSARGDVERTIFVVGDEKQSIYSFQGAEPAAFGQMRKRFTTMLDGLDRALQDCDLIYSFRSAQPILDVVDAVFAGPAGDQFGGGVKHDAVDPEAPGRVELWPFLEPDAKADEPPWDAPLDMPGPDDPAARLADRIATTIRGWLDAGRVLPWAGGRAIRAGDVLILVQRRGAVFDAVIRALKRAEVPVAGADVLRVGGELAVRDLLAALRVAATPADDLSLAAFLRSPIGGFSERDLFALAHGRPGTLWQALNAAEPAPPARDILRDLRAQADYLRPFEMLQRLLIRHDGRRRLIARLRAEAEDGIDALLELALAYERVEPPSLTSFLDWIDRDAVTVKRRIEDDADQVRVMTVHGAKGLEAPIVILPDTAPRNEGAHPPQVLRLGDGAVWRMRADASPPLFSAAEAERRAAVAAENRRLLYVALTRAARWLIVAGAGKAGPSGWHTMVAEALDGLDPLVEAGPDGPVKSLSHRWTTATATAPAAPCATGLDLPPWARRPPPPPTGALPPVAPSALGGAHALPGEGADEAEARARGAALHLLLETLPARPRTDWPDLAARVIPRHPDRDALLAEANAVLDDPDLAFLFAPGTLAEVEVTAPIAALGGRRLTGRIDRLVVTEARVLAVDFKSNRVRPVRPCDTPEAILRQLGAYAAALAPIWPGRAIATAVLWTRGPMLMEIPAALTTAALDRAARLDPAPGHS